MLNRQSRFAFTSLSNSVVAVVLSLFFAPQAFAAPTLDCSNEPAWRASRDPAVIGGSLSQPNLTLFGVTVPDHAMSDLASPLPAPHIADDDPACASCSDYACYLSDDKSVAAIFYRYASWDLQGFEIVRTRDAKLPQQCIETTIASDQFVTASDIGIGIMPEYTAQQLGIELVQLAIESDQVSHELYFEKQILMSQKEIDQHLRQTTMSGEPTCNDFYMTQSTFVTLTFAENELIQYSVSYMDVW
uniref:hypothetical protein n=1 Tax=Thaumasiovibrio occultus TaxID=1891184 RepID=UPI000B35849F|nr:hypothetical protein [Thaumasiovibrio occultus]